ncbi:hypothetical protein KR222_006414, partial [Zaprionus bogoriensis]
CSTITMNKESGLILQRYVANCRKLQIEEEIVQNAIKTFHKVNADGVLSNEADDWLCCSVYSELQKTKMKDMREESSHPKTDELGSWERKSRCNSWNISLTKLLRIFGINIKRFLKRMEHWNWMAQNSKVFQQEIGDLDRRLGITLLALQHYRRIFKQLYVMPQSEKSRTHYHMLYEFGWLLFLVLRNELPSFATTNLINGCQLLLCVIELVYVNALEVSNSDVINAEFAGVPAKWSSDDFDPNWLNKYSALEAICQLLPELPEKGVGIMKKVFFYKAVMALFMDQRLLGNDRFMRTLVKDGILEVNLSSLNRSYATHVADISEIDERVLLNHNTEQSSAPMEAERVVECKEMSPSMSATQRDNLEKLLGQHLPRSLPTYIGKVLGKADANSLQSSLRDMCSKIEDAASLSQETSEARFTLVRGLYYQLLDNIMSAELRRRPTMRVAQMLIQLQRTFNATLIACCLELVLHVYAEGQAAVAFPWLLECFSIDSYNFQKILELVVRHENGILTRDLIRHLQEIEAQCLSSLIWQKNSQLFKSGSLPSCQEVQENSRLPAGSSMICLRKFYHLANQRLAKLCKGLSLLTNYTQIWHIMEHSIVVHGTELLQQRHLDQLLMCAIYLYVRSSRLRITFSDIIQQYRRLAHARSAIYRSVLLADGKSQADIITFYNRVYVRRMANYARELHCEQSSEKSLVSRPLQDLSNRNTTMTRSKSYGNNTNVFVSPEAPPYICTADVCKAKIITKLATPQNLKRALSNNELGKFTPSKRPNILRRRTTF